MVIRRAAILETTASIFIHLAALAFIAVPVLWTDLLRELLPSPVSLVIGLVVLLGIIRVLLPVRLIWRAWWEQYSRVLLSPYGFS